MQIKNKPGRRPTGSVVLHCRYHCYYNKQHKNLQHFLNNFRHFGTKENGGLAAAHRAFAQEGFRNARRLRQSAKKREICHKL